MRLEMIRRAVRRSFVAFAVVAFASLTACSGSDETGVESTASELEGNVEQSGEIMKDTWEADRARGEGAVEAAGDAYEGVLEEGRKKAEEEK